MSTALVCLAAAASDAPVVHTTSPARADFVAHLIATSAQVPQTRVRRRAEPDEAIAAYRALGQWPIPCGRGLSRAL